MLIRMDTLHRIKSGEITLAFRKWRKPTVRAGSTIRTAVGMLSVARVERVCADEISQSEAIAAGFFDLNSLHQELNKREGDLYLIGLSYAGEDPRIRLRESEAMTADDLRPIRDKLTRLDQRAPAGAWTRQTLKAIQNAPGQSAATLASQLSSEKETLKKNVRKLKNLGLTISLKTGYRISPRGRIVLDSLPISDDD